MSDDEIKIEIGTHYFYYYENETKETIKISKVLVLESTRYRFFRVYDGTHTVVAHDTELHKRSGCAISKAIEYYNNLIKQTESTLKRLKIERVKTKNLDFSEKTS